MDSIRRWRFGPCALWIHRIPREWRDYASHQDDPTLNFAEESDPVPASQAIPAITQLLPRPSVSRLVSSRTDDRVSLLPRLPDRPVIIQTDHPLSIMGHQSADLFVGIPVWIHLSANVTSKFILDVPSFRPSDIWFGHSTREGELCYASRTTGHVRLDDVNRRWYRAVSRITLDNPSSEPLVLERIRLPVQHLALYQASDSHLWAQSVRMTHSDSNELVELSLDRDAPTEAGTAKMICGPRESVTQNIIVRAFSSLFHKFRDA